MMSRRIIVFAKAPRPRDAKTRLGGVLSGRGRAELQRTLSLHTLSTVCRSGLAPVELWCTPAVDHRFFLECAECFPVQLHRQQGDDLGARMYGALGQALAQCKQVILVGTDCPKLDQPYLRSAFDALQSGCELVIGPAEDGGYVLIGATRIHGSLFDSITWGSSRVLQQTRTALQELGWSWAELAPRWDVDRPRDLLRLMAEPQWGFLRTEIRRSMSSKPHLII